MLVRLNEPRPKGAVIRIILSCETKVRGASIEAAEQRAGV